MNRTIRKTMITGTVSLLFAVLAFHVPSAAAKKKAPSFSKKIFSLKKGNRTKVSIKNASPKKVKWSVNKAGKSVITLSAKNKKSVMVRGKKAGTATVTAKITLKGKNTKTLRAKIKVRDASTAEKGSKTNGKKVSFPGKVVTSLTNDGYVRLQWDKSGEAEKYEVQRKTAAGTWKRLKNTFSTSCTDKKVEENSTYYYRIRVKMLSGKYSAFSDVVIVRTGKITTSEAPVPTVAPINGYEPQYDYKISLLNKIEKYPLYNGKYTKIFLYIETKNPDSSSINLYSESGTKIDCLYMNLGIYDDINVKDGLYIYPFAPVAGGYVVCINISDCGEQKVSICERKDNPGKDFLYSREAASITLEVEDYDSALNRWQDEMIERCSDETMSISEKIIAIRDYLRVNYDYGTKDMQGNIVRLAQEDAAPYFERHYGNCEVCAYIMAEFCEKLGIDYYVHSPEDNSWHVLVTAKIEGTEYDLEVGSGYKYMDYEMLV